MSGPAPSRLPTSSTLVGLELLRGLACVEVVLGHLPWPKKQFLNLALWTVGGCGGEAVIVFFVLSGYVIALSQQQKHRSFTEFMRARFRRLMPLYLMAVFGTVPLEMWLHPQTPMTATVGLHLAFLQYPPVYLFQNNLPLWSLSFEFYFYLAFAMTMGRWQNPLRWVWCILGLAATVACCLGFRVNGFLGHLDAILAYSPVWLLGSILINDRYCPPFTLRQSLILAGMIPLIRTLHTLVPTAPMPGMGPLVYLLDGLLAAPLICSLARVSRGIDTPNRAFLWAVVAVLYVVLATFFISTATWENAHFPNLISVSYSPALYVGATLGAALLRHRSFFTPRLTRLSLGMGRLSYVVYMIHNPLLLLAGALIPFVPLQLIIILPAIFAVAWMMEYRLQPRLSTWFDILWPSRR